MHNKVIHLDPANDPRWDEFVMSHKDGLIFHHSLWKEVIEQTYGYKPVYFAVVDEKNRIKAGIPCCIVKKPFAGSRLVSLPLSDFCDPLYDDENDLQILYDAIFEESKKNNISAVEFRMINCSHSAKLPKMVKEEDYVNHLLELSPNPDEVQSSFAKDIRRCIRKAQKLPLKIEDGKAEKDLKTFYRLYLSTRKRRGLLPQPYTFFANIWKHLKTSDIVFITLIYEDSRAVVGSLNLLFKNRLYMLYAGSDTRAFKGKTGGRDHLITWQDIEKGIERGAKQCDFGRTAISNTGLMHFKKKWGTSIHKIYHFSTPTSGKFQMPDKSKFQGTFVHEVTKRLPDPVLKLSGQLLYKHLM